VNRCISCAHTSFHPDCDCCQIWEHCETCYQPKWLASNEDEHYDAAHNPCWCCECHGEYPCPGGLHEYPESYSPTGQTPWELRGEHIPKNPKYPHWKAAWPVLAAGHQELDPCAAAADFYVLDALRHALINRDHECEQRPCHHFEFWQRDLAPEERDAEDRFFQLIIFLDRLFCDYVEMACGGELRHHTACGGKSLSTHRRTAWADWKWIHEQLGHQALLDGADLFDQFPGGAFGGARWAHALRLLHKRLTNQITAITYIDQVFTLVHNGGVFLNKLDWAVKNPLGLSLHDLQTRVLPAQQQDSWSFLLRVCTPEVRRLWDHYWRSSNRARVSMAVRPTQNIRTFTRRRTMCSYCGSNPRYGHTLSCSNFLSGALQAGHEPAVEHIDEDNWPSRQWHVWSQELLPVSPEGRITMLPFLSYSLWVEVHSTYMARIRKFALTGSALMQTTMRFNRSMPTVPGWEDDDDTEFWFVITLMDPRERVRLAAFESRKTTNREAFKKKYVTFGHILPLVMPDIDWSHLTKEFA